MFFVFSKNIFVNIFIINILCGKLAELAFFLDIVLAANSILKGLKYKFYYDTISK